MLMWDAFRREDGSVVYNCCWPSPAQSFSGPSPVELLRISYCLRFETSFIVASYNSQGYGGGIQTRTHTRLSVDLKVKVQVTLRLAIYRQSISIGARPLETHNKRFNFSNWTLAVIVLMQNPLLTGRWVCLLWMYLAFRQVYISHT
jgi:hypothetical protein